MARPSIARQFYEQIVGAADPFSLFRGWVNSSPPTIETEWRDFKAGVSLTDEKKKELWSKALSGFANTQGGVLLWGFDCRKSGNPPVDHVSALSLVEAPQTLASRLMELHHLATEPPVLGIEVSSFVDPLDPAKGAVACFIPESPFRPHRAEFAHKQYYIRAGDDLVVPSVSLLRSLFVPNSAASLTPIVEFQTHDVPVGGGGRMTRLHFNGYVRNTGLVSAEGALVTVHGTYQGDFSSPQNWRKHDTAISPISFESPRAIFPGETMQLFRYIYPQAIRSAGNENYEFPRQFLQRFEFRIFSHNQSPIKATVEFNEEDIVHRVRKPCTVEELN